MNSSLEEKKINTIRGKFILFEGVDRCGKTTQSLKLVENLKKQGVDAVHIRFPTTDTDIGKTIRLFLTNKIELDKRSIYLMFAADRWQEQKNIQQLLDEGKTVVCDRYSPSGIAFGTASGLDLEWCKKIEEGMIKPDIVYYLSLPIEVAEKRGGFGEERYEKKEFQKKVKSIYENDLFGYYKSWIFMDADNSREDLEKNLFGLTFQHYLSLHHSGLL